MKFKTKEELAKYTIEYFLENHKSPQINEKDIDDSLKIQASCFVTVYIYGKLRGCIGDIESDEPLFQNIIKRSISAVSEDFRFLPINISELPNLSVEVSVLSPIERYKKITGGKLIDYLAKERCGVVLEKDGRKALFLPQVWEDLPDPEEFLQNLCLKAGLSPEDWKSDATTVYTFTVEK